MHSAMCTTRNVTSAGTSRPGPILPKNTLLIGRRILKSVPQCGDLKILLFLWNSKVSGLFIGFFFWTLVAQNWSARLLGSWHCPRKDRTCLLFHFFLTKFPYGSLYLLFLPWGLSCICWGFLCFPSSQSCFWLLHDQVILAPPFLVSASAGVSFHSLWGLFAASFGKWLLVTSWRFWHCYKILSLIDLI